MGWRLCSEASAAVKNRPKHVGAINNRNIVQQVGITYCMCNIILQKMCNIEVYLLLNSSIFILVVEICWYSINNFMQHFDCGHTYNNIKLPTPQK